MKPMPVEEHPRCNFTKCLAGQGLAGKGTCFLRGEWDNPECPRFVDEKEWIKAREKEAL
jgi:hypothetical protein